MEERYLHFSQTPNLIFCYEMFTFKRNINIILPTFSNFISPFCVKSSNIGGAFEFAVGNNFSPEEHLKILAILNESTPEDLSRYHISNVRIKGISDWRTKKGPFRSLNEVLEVEGFGEKILEELCKNITSNNVAKAKLKKHQKTNKYIKHLLVPDLGIRLFNSLQSAVAIHLDPTGIGWARLEKTNNVLTDWKFENFSSLPMKMMPSDTFYLATSIIKATPSGDAYIFEGPSNLSPQSQTKQSLVSAHNHKVELISMLLALLNTSIIHNHSLHNVSSEEIYSQSIENRVFCMRNKVPARLFNTLIGSEKVSAISAVTGLIKKDPVVLQSLPCTPVNFGPSLDHSFSNQTPTSKELMGQALMLGISFMDLCIRRNPVSYDALQPNRHKKKYDLKNLA